MTGSATTTPSGRTRRSRPRAPVTPAERFQPAPAEQRELLPLWLPGAAGRRPGAAAHADRRARGRRRRRAELVAGGPVEFDRVGPALGEPVGDAPPVLARPAAGRADRPLLGRRRRHPPHDRRRPRQEPALAPERRRSRPARGRGRRRRPARRRCRRPRTARRSRSTARSTTAASSASPAAGARRRDPRRPPGDRPHRTRHADVPGPRHARAARVRPNPLTHEQALRLQGARPAGPPPRPRTEPVTVQRRVSATGVIMRLPPTRLARPRPRRPHRHRPRLRAHARHRARRRNPHDPPHHQPARRRRQGQPAAPRPGNVNGTLCQRGTGNGATHIDRDQEPQNPYET